MFKKFKKIDLYPSLIKLSDLDYDYASKHLFDANKLFLINGTTNVYLNDEVSDKFLHSMGMSCAALSKVAFNDSFINVVSVDSFFMQLPKVVQTFFIYHEVGHAINNDLENTDNEMSQKLIIMRSHGKLPLMEVKADMYAASVIGFENAKKALAFLVCRVKAPKHIKKEFIKRYSYLRKHRKEIAINS